MPQSIFNLATTKRLYSDLKAANTEAAKKERLIQYLTKMFVSDDGAQKLISDMTLGAERTISNIPRASGIGRGRADTQTETIIIEWENDLRRTGEHAREQLEEYLIGNWRSGQPYRFVLITTDGLRWRRFAPEWGSLPDEGKALSQVDLREVEKYDLSEDNAPEFPFFLDALLFGNQPRPATLARIQSDFGDTSTVFINSLGTLSTVSDDVRNQSELKVAFDQWRRFLSLAYGEFDSSPSMFLVHTYLSVFAKFIAYAVVTGRAVPDENAMRSVLNGDAFRSMNIERFVEDDFFHWVHSEEYFDQLKPMFREISRRIQEYDFTDVSEDILKGVYQELIDLETRHALGEYYTPDWLCDKVVKSLPVQRDSRILDPACGSGSFLRAAVARLREIDPSTSAEALAKQVAGIDIHPLSVQIAKTTMLLALGDKVVEAKRPIVLHIFLANSLLVPRGSANLFETNFEVSVDNKPYTLDVKGFSAGDQFDRLIALCHELVERNEQELDREAFKALIRKSIPEHTAPTLPSQLHDIYCAMKQAKEAGRDSIWKFILQNSYKPVFLRQKFDLIVGNPPWLTYADVGSAEYQELLKSLSDQYGTTPTKKNIPHLEIASIFLSHSVNYFLSEAGGTLAFVLPRSFMTADQHHNTRVGAVEGLRVKSIWDLKEVAPLFRVPSCVLFVVPEEESAKRRLPKSGLSGLSISARLPAHNLDFEGAKEHIQDTSQRWYYSTLSASRGKRVRSAYTRTRVEGRKGSNAYSRFKQGATIVPRNFYLIDIDQDLPRGADLSDRTIAVKTAHASEKEAKKPWKGKLLSGRLEGDLLFRTAISRNMLPFCLISPLLVSLPIITKKSGGKDAYKLLEPKELFAEGYTDGSSWFDAATKKFERFKSESYRKTEMTLLKRLDYQRGLSAQDPKARHLVLYTSSATDASAVVIDRDDFDLPFIADHKTYWCEVRSEDEGHYVAAFLNSDYANQAIKDFQSQGLFGERDIHKLIVMIPLPAFEARNNEHARIAKLGKKCAAKAVKIAESNGWDMLDARSLGRARSHIRTRLAKEMAEIGVLFTQVNNDAASFVRKAKEQRKMAGAGPLFGEE